MKKNGREETIAFEEESKCGELTEILSERGSRSESMRTQTVSYLALRFVCLGDLQVSFRCCPLVLRHGVSLA